MPLFFKRKFVFTLTWDEDNTIVDDNNILAYCFYKDEPNTPIIMPNGSVTTKKKLSDTISPYCLYRPISLYGVWILNDIKRFSKIVIKDYLSENNFIEWRSSVCPNLKQDIETFPYL